MKHDQTTLWRLTWSHARGVYWLAMRLCDQESAAAWLDVFARDEPGVTFALGRKAPSLPDNARELARHVAMFR
jgi:hypothetical protein